MSKEVDELINERIEKNRKASQPLNDVDEQGNESDPVEEMLKRNRENQKESD